MVVLNGDAVPILPCDVACFSSCQVGYLLLFCIFCCLDDKWTLKLCVVICSEKHRTKKGRVKGLCLRELVYFVLYFVVGVVYLSKLPSRSFPDVKLY